MMAASPVVLMILDGWGHSADCEGNAIAQAHPRNFNYLEERYPSTLLQCSGSSVGLPPGQMGNSEVGHLNIGAGRIVYQEISRISQAIDNGSFFRNYEFIKAINRAKQNAGEVHIMGLLSDGGVHSHIDHLFALLQLCQQQRAEVYVHCFLDGRDVPPRSALLYIDMLEKQMKAMGTGRIATVSGRYYAMDRDNRWERIEKAYRAMVLGTGVIVPDASTGVQNNYSAGVNDEFMEPMVVLSNDDCPSPTIKTGDSIIFFNFRADRARQITRAFVDPHFAAFHRPVEPEVYFVGMTGYDKQLACRTAFWPQSMKNTLGQVLAAAGKRQLRIAETEKYAHVTFFFNGGIEEACVNEDRILVPSPPVTTYDLKPEMSASEVTQKVIEQIERDYYDAIIMNYANPDMVGHTGILEAAVKAVQAVDKEMIKVVEIILEKKGTVLITSDHGNCEKMIDPHTGKPHTAHTEEKVPFILVNDSLKDIRLGQSGSLQDIAPTLLSLMNITAPPEMTGRSLL